MDERTSDLPRRTDDGLYSIMLRPCTAEVLVHLLDPEIPFVWVADHQPDGILEWWTCHLPLTKFGQAYSLDVRALRYDLLMPTREFLPRLAEFDGLAAYQMRRKVPNTLIIERLDERNIVPILVQNGLFAKFYLPHAMECSSFATVERSTIEKALANKAIRALAY